MQENTKEKKNTQKIIVGLVLLVVIGLVGYYFGFELDVLRDGEGEGAIREEPSDTTQSLSQRKMGFFGITLAGNPTEGLAVLDLTRQTGRVWSLIYDDRMRTYDLGQTDDHIRKAQELGLDTILVLKTGNHLAMSDSNCYTEVQQQAGPDPHLHSCPFRPEYRDEWKDFVRTIIERYDGDGIDDMPGLDGSVHVDYQIENEAGNRFFWYVNEMDGGVAAEEYLEILKLANEARDEADPTARIILPGFVHPQRLARCAWGDLPEFVCESPFETRNREFTKELLRHPELFDALDVHLFVYTIFDPDYVEDSIQWLREEMSSNGYEKPIYSLEWTSAIMLMVKDDRLYEEFAEHFPYTEEFPGSTPQKKIEVFTEIYQNLDEHEKYREWFESEQAMDFAKLFTQMNTHGVEKLVHVQFHDYFGEGWDNVWWNWQGIIRYEGSFANPIVVKKPSYYTYNILAENLEGFDTSREIDIPGALVYEFTFNDKDPVYVAWTEEGDKTIDISQYVSGDTVTITQIVTELDEVNNPIYRKDKIHKANSIPISSEPVFIEVIAHTTDDNSSEENSFVLADSSGNFRLFGVPRVIDGTKLTSRPPFYILDEQDVLITENLLDEYTTADIFYDEVNKGFIFITRYQAEDAKDAWSDNYIDVHFFDFGSRALQTIHSVGPVYIAGHGCEPSRLMSTKGEVVMTPGCETTGLTTENDGLVHIPLP